MSTYEGTKEKTETARGGKKPRVLWPEYTPEEREILRKKMISGWDDLGYLNDYWNIVYDERDSAQYQSMAKVWQLRETGLTFDRIGTSLGIDPGKAGGLVTGYNRRPNLALMYLNRERLGPPREGKKWILDCTPKPTNPYPKALQVPERIRDHNDILEFLEQFPSVNKDSEALRFFGLSSEWAKEHRADLFWFLMAFLVGDGGKYYSDYSTKTRHYRKTAMNTRMTNKDSNFRVLRYVQLAMESLEIQSQQVKSEATVVSWHSEATDVLTWMMSVCIGLQEGERTSTHKVKMDWLLKCPKNLIVAFLQGLADSDGYVDKKGRYSEIASVPNAKFYADLIRKTGFEAKAYPLGDKPRMTRVSIETAARMPLFSPIIRSYRFEELVRQARNRNIPPPPSFFH